MTALNIFLSQTAYPPSIGGAQAYLHQLACHLMPQHKVQVASFWRENRTDWLWGTTVMAPGGKPYQIDGVTVTPLTLTRVERRRLLPWTLAYYAWQEKAIQAIASVLLPYLRQTAVQPHLIHHGRVGREPLGFASLALARERRIPFVLTPFHHPRWRGWPYHHYHRLYREADAIIALTPFERDTLVALGVASSRIDVTGTGPVLSKQVDAMKFRQKYGLSGPVVLFLGQKYPYKGFAQLLAAAPIVWQKMPEVQFLFVGPRTKSSRSIFRRQARDSRLLELGAVCLEEKTAALAVCDVLCVPSTQESFGSVYVEAWQMGKPVIGASIPAVAQVIEDGVDGFVGPVNPRWLAEKLVLLLSDADLRTHMGANGRRKVEANYTWPVLAEKTAAIYYSLL